MVKNMRDFKNKIFMFGLLVISLGVGLASVPVYGMENELAAEQEPVNLLTVLSEEHRDLLAGHSQDDLEKAAETIQAQQFPAHKKFAELVARKRRQEAIPAQQQAEQVDQDAQQENSAQDGIAGEHGLEHELEQNYVIGLLYALGAKHKSNGAWYDTQKQKNIRSTTWARRIFIAAVFVSAGLVSFGYNVPCMPRSQ
jgi:hypothetical protein